MKVNLSFEQLIQLIRQLSDSQKSLIRSALNEDLKTPNSQPKKRKAGGLKGFITFMAEDFDAPIEDMKPYMQ